MRLQAQANEQKIILRVEELQEQLRNKNQYIQQFYELIEERQDMITELKHENNRIVAQVLQEMGLIVITK